MLRVNSGTFFGRSWRKLESRCSIRPGRQTEGGLFVWRFAVLVAMAFVVVSCSPDAEVTGSTNKCATDLYPSYNPKVLDQCVGACIKCDRGTTCVYRKPRPGR